MFFQGRIGEHCQEIANIQLEDQRDSQEDKDDFIFPNIPEGLALPDEIEQVIDDVGPTEQTCLNVSETSLEDQSCLTIQPDRVLRGVSVKLFLVTVHFTIMLYF